MALRSFVGFLFLASAFVVGVSKECTNIPTQLSSHTVRSQLMTTDNQTWKEEMLSHYHLTPTDETAWLGLLPRKLLNEESPVEQFDWVMLYRSMKGFAGTNEVAAGVDFLRDVSLHDVRLDPDSLFGQAQQTNLEYLLMLDVDRLVWNFRNQAGLSAPGKPYGGWESPKMELRGHFVGHYMSACAQMWASTHNETLYETMSLVVDVLYDCQKKIGTGYLSAFPSEFFDRFEAIQYVWAPYYTIHKIMAGLLDQYLLVDNAKALEMVVWMAEYFGNRVKKVLQNYTIERHWKSLNEETGGMNDVLYRLYSITNDQKHLVLAHLFDKPCFLGLLAIQADSLSGFHSNTHIPVVVGAQMRYEVTGDPLYKEIGAFFMDIVNSSHSYATGGTSVGEFWYDPKRLANTLSTESEESCTTYNMLKISRNLFRWTKEIAYADYYERALTNGVLSIQRGREPGVMIYMLPQGPGQSKAQGYHGWGTKYDSFWCCYGTGIESFSKLGDSIYFEDRGVTPSLYIIQYVSSSFSWKYGGLMINQKIAPISSSNPYLQVLVTISANESNGQYSTLNMRIPSWTSQDGTAAVLNDQVLPLPDPGNFLSVTKKWTSNDKIEIKFLVHLRTEALKDDRPDYKSIQAILFGPYLLAGLTSGDWDIERNSTSISDWISPIPDSYNSQLISLAQECNNSLFIFSNSNGSLNMDDWPGEGTNSVVHGTFRVFNEDSQDQSFVIPNKDAETTFMLEPFDLPGMVIEHQGPESNLTVSTPSGKDNKFKFVSGLDGKPNTVSIESSSQPGCFIFGGVGYSAGIRVQLACQAYSTDMMSFRQAASFLLVTGLRMYHPISFVAKGARRNFVLEPLLSLKDETYTVYFNIQT